MPDISMCRNKECPSYSRCYRAQAVPNPRRQSIMKFDHKGGSRCEYFWQIDGGAKVVDAEEQGGI